MLYQIVSHKILCIMGLLMLPHVATAQFPVNYLSSTVNVARLSSDFSDFQWKWRGYDDQRAKLTFNDNGSAFIVAGYNMALQVAKEDTSYVLIGNASIVKSLDNCTFSLNHTNIPPNEVYKVDVLL